MTLVMEPTEPDPLQMIGVSVRLRTQQANSRVLPGVCLVQAPPRRRPRAHTSVSVSVSANSLNWRPTTRAHEAPLPRVCPHHECVFITGVTHPYRYDRAYQVTRCPGKLASGEGAIPHVPAPPRKAGVESPWPDRRSKCVTPWRSGFVVRGRDEYLTHDHRVRDTILKRATLGVKER